MIGNCDCCDRCDVPGSVVDCPGEPFACHLCQGDTDPDPYGELETCLMQVDRGFSRNTVVMCEVDLSSGIAGKISCIECGGDGDWSKFMPEPTDEPCPCVECKGTGRVFVSV